MTKSSCVFITSTLAEVEAQQPSVKQVPDGYSPKPAPKDKAKQAPEGYPLKPGPKDKVKQVPDSHPPKP